MYFIYLYILILFHAYKSISLLFMYISLSADFEIITSKKKKKIAACFIEIAKIILWLVIKIFGDDFDRPDNFIKKKKKT